MANKIIIKKSSVAGKVPAAGDLEIGELAVNLTDQKLYSKNASGAVVQLGGGSGSGDVVGPSSATDNALARFDGATGKLIQNGVGVLDDSGNLSGINSISDPDYVAFNTAYATPLTAGQLGWDGNNTLGLGMAGGNVTQHIGEDQFYYIKASSTITKGQVIMFTGAVGASGILKGAPATGISDGSYIMGIAAEAIATNSFGLVQSFGVMRNVNTSAYTDGQILWYNPSVTGGLTATKPSAPNVKVQMAAVVNGGSSGGGTIQIRVNSGSTLGGTDSNAEITSPTSGNTLIYDATAGYWKNANLTDGTGIIITEGAGSITVTNSGVTSLTGTTNEIDVSASTGAVTLSLPATINADTTGNAATATSAGKWTTARTLSFTGDATGSGSIDGSANVATALTLANTTVTAGSYTNTSLTVDAKGRITAASSGTAPVTSVTGTSPVASSGGTTPAISLASAYGDTQNPYGSKTANYFLAAPNGSAGSPSFRAIVAADIPTLNQNTTGSAGSVANALTIGTGLSGSSYNGSSAVTVALENTAVTAGSYTNTNITVDAQGRITAASNGTSAGGTVTSVSGTGTVAGITLSGTVTSSGSLTLGGTFALPNGAIAAKQTIDSFTATASQTTFTTSASYTSGDIDVYANGIRMRNGTDVTVTSGTQVVFASGLAAGTLVDIEYFV